MQNAAQRSASRPTRGSRSRGRSPICEQLRRRGRALGLDRYAPFIPFNLICPILGTPLGIFALRLPHGPVLRVRSKGGGIRYALGLAGSLNLPVDARPPDRDKGGGVTLGPSSLNSVTWARSTVAGAPGRACPQPTRGPAPLAGPTRSTHPTRADRRLRPPAAGDPWSRSSCPHRTPHCASRRSTPLGRSPRLAHGLLCGDPRHCSLQMDDAHQGAPDTGRVWARRPKPTRLVEIRSLRLGSHIVRPRLHDAGQHAAGSGAAALGFATRRLLVIPLDARTSSPDR